jgi:hypothetical protein
MKTYRAPWSKMLITITSAVSLLCIGMATGFMISQPGLLPWGTVIPLVIVIGGALFTIRGYTLTADALLVHRLFWNTRISLKGLQSVHMDSEAMNGSIRTFGNGGLFSFSGRYRNKKLGAYRAFVTDMNNTVVLTFPKRTVVVSPESPEAFVRDIET